ncbi:MAG: HD domain-containing protein [Lachnospiraceae bacterium]|nr:HD domain-containing protein [Lachnospiraceae bacterium]
MQNNEKKIVEAAVHYIEALFQNNADGHDAAHSLRVYHNTMAILDAELSCGAACSDGVEPCDEEVIALAALLHDVDDHKLFQTENNANARLFLTEQEVPAEKIELICEVINGVSFSKNRGKRPATLEGKIVQDADRLDALGAIGIARTFAYGGKHGRSLDASVEHFYEKLLLLKDEMNTDGARKMAEERHAFLEAFLDEYKKES